MPSILPLKETKGPDRIRTVSPNLKVLLVGSFERFSFIFNSDQQSFGDE